MKKILIAVLCIVFVSAMRIGMADDGWFKSLMDAADVDKTAPSDGQALLWDDVDQLWRAGNVTTGSSNHTIQNDSVAVSSYNTTNFIAGSGITLAIANATNRTNITIASSAGGGNVSGSGANTQISYFTGTNTVAGNANMIFNSTTNLTTINNLTLTNPLADASVANDITLTNITQITTRSHTLLTDIGTNTHTQIDTHIAAANPHSDSLNKTLASANIFVGNATNVATAVAMSGDVAISNTGATTIQDNSVDGTDIALGSDTQGDVMYYNGTDWVRLGAGSAGNFLQTNGAGANPSWNASLGNMQYTDTRYKVGTFTRDTSLAGGTQAITGLGFAPKAIIFLAVQDGAVGETSWGFSDAANDVCLQNAYNEVAGRFYAQPTVSIYDAESSSLTYTGEVSSLDSDGFTITWVRSSTPTGTLTIYYLALR